MGTSKGIGSRHTPLHKASMIWFCCLCLCIWAWMQIEEPGWICTCSLVHTCVHTDSRHDAAAAEGLRGQRMPQSVIIGSATDGLNINPCTPYQITLWYCKPHATHTCPPPPTHTYIHTHTHTHVYVSSTTQFTLTADGWYSVWVNVSVSE